MSAMYSRAFDHITDTQNEIENDSDYTYQDPEVYRCCYVNSTFLKYVKGRIYLKKV
jgi:hypothetical protein